MICYFVIITSGEDIWQGAASQVDIIGDSLAAFNHSVRLADMFAWSIINFFDYSYHFGPDTILRLVDVFAAFSIFYMATYIVLRRRPRLKLADATVFCGIFLAVFLTSNGLTLYAGFSKIHNYLFITFFSLVFGIFYLRDLWGREAPKTKLFPLIMLVLGFLFGFASNVTAIVFLIALAIYGLYIHSKSGLYKFIFSWRFMGVIGILLSIALMYLVGNGLGDYDTNPAYLTVCDYVPLAEIFENFGASFPRLIWHNVYNFGRFLLPFLVATLPVAIYGLLKHLKPNFKALKPHKNFLVASLIFVFIHVFAMSQIIYPTRLVLPAYIFGFSIFFFVLKEIFVTAKVKDVVSEKAAALKKVDFKKAGTLASKTLKNVAVVFLILATAITVMRGYFAVTYVSRINAVLEEIKNTETEIYCVDLKTATAESLPYIHLGQEDFLVDWAMPQTIYQKTITYCE